MKNSIEFTLGKSYCFETKTENETDIETKNKGSIFDDPFLNRKVRISNMSTKQCCLENR